MATVAGTVVAAAQAVGPRVGAAGAEATVSAEVQGEGAEAMAGLATASCSSRRSCCRSSRIVPNSTSHSGYGCSRNHARSNHTHGNSRSCETAADIQRARHWSRTWHRSCNRSYRRKRAQRCALAALICPLL